MMGLVFSLQSAWAFSLGGPIGNNPNPRPIAGIPGGDSWQIASIGYGLGGDLLAPKNLGEDYRRNTPVIYYCYDENFASFFGTNSTTSGEAAVDRAFAILNAAFTNNPSGMTNGLDGYSIPLTEIPVETRHVNYQAQALGLYDLKSWALAALVEQLGLADPVRYNWTLHDRFHVGTIGCPVGMEYLVVQRNYNNIASDLTQVQYSPYVNDVLYSYVILELCNPPAPPDALSVPYSVDPLADNYSAVAGALGGLVFIPDPNTGAPVLTFVPGVNTYGTFYTGLTRDDVAGLRYMFTTNNVHREDVPPGALRQDTNGVFGFLSTSNLTGLLQASRTNDPVTLATLFPGLVVSGSISYPGVITNPIVVAYLTNYYGDPVGSPPHLVVKTNGFTYTPVTLYSNTFNNVIITTNFFTYSFSSNTLAQKMTVTVGVPVGSPVGSPVQTNTSFQKIILTNVISGDFFLIPPGSCGPAFITPQPSGYPVPVITTVTNVIAATTNSAGNVSSQSIVITTTNHIFAVYPCTLTTNATDYYQGIERIQFVRVPDTNFDSYNRVFYQPVTNIYTMVVVTNGQYITKTFQRIVTQPDIFFSADDITAGNGGAPVVGDYARTQPFPFDQANVLPGLAGPGTITPEPSGTEPVSITFNKVGPVFFNNTVLTGVMDGTPYFTEEPGVDADLFYEFYFLWSSYDGTTNPPVVYPNGTTLVNLQNQVLIQVLPAGLPDGNLNQSYDSADATFSATGGQPPYTWSLANSPQPLPVGLSLSSDGVISGTPTGTAGTFDFTIQLTDSAIPPRTLQLNYSININP